MSREIKFRVWDNWQKKYVFTDFHVIGEVTVFGGIDMVISETREARFAALGYETSCEAWDDFELEEWTGLVDKNSKDIYEGDIVRATVDTDAQHQVIGDVVFDVETLSFCFGNNMRIKSPVPPAIDYRNLRRYGMSTILEVIGNIRENPELLST